MKESVLNIRKTYSEITKITVGFYFVVLAGVGIQASSNLVCNLLHKDSVTQATCQQEVTSLGGKITLIGSLLSLSGMRALAKTALKYSKLTGQVLPEEISEDFD